MVELEQTISNLSWDSWSLGEHLDRAPLKFMSETLLFEAAWLVLRTWFRMPFSWQFELEAQ
jgi:hypothetical protein